MQEITAEMYEYRVFWYPPDECFFARCAELPGISAFSEESMEGALQEILSLVDFILKDMAETGEVPPRPLWLGQVVEESLTRMQDPDPKEEETA